MTGADALERYRAEQTARENQEVQRLMRKATGETLRKLTYIQGQLAKGREPADEQLLKSTRRELLRSLER